MERIKCRFHPDKTASMVVYPDGYFCFGCGAKGPLSAIGREESEVVSEKYVEDIGRTIPDILVLPVRYIRGLHLHCDDSGYFIVWPTRDYYKKRVSGQVSESGKYKGPSGVSKPLFIARQDPFHDTLVIVEGELNAMSIELAVEGVDVVSPGGAGDFYGKRSEKDIALYTQYAKILIIVDADKAGAIAGIKLASKLRPTGRLVTIKMMEQDANDILVKYGREAVAKEVYESLGMQGRMPGREGTVPASGAATPASERGF